MNVVRGLAIALVLSACSSEQTTAPSSPSQGPRLQLPPDNAPVALNSDNVPQFIAWGRGARRNALNDQIIAARGRPGVVDALFKEVDKCWQVVDSKSVISDMSTCVFVIGIIEPLESPDAVNLANGLAWRPYPSDLPRWNPDGTPTERAYVGMLEMAAVQVLLCRILMSDTTAQSDLATLAATHPANEVRGMAADKGYTGCYF